MCVWLVFVVNYFISITATGRKLLCSLLWHVFVGMPHICLLSYAAVVAIVLAVVVVTVITLGGYLKFNCAENFQVW